MIAEIAGAGALTSATSTPGAIVATVALHGAIATHMGGACSRSQSSLVGDAASMPATIGWSVATCMPGIFMPAVSAAAGESGVPGMAHATPAPASTSWKAKRASVRDAMRGERFMSFELLLGRPQSSSRNLGTLR